MDVINHSRSNDRLKNFRIESNNISPTLTTRCDSLGVVIKYGKQ